MEIFREKNIPLESDEINLSSDYGKTIGNILIKFEGKEYTLQQIRKVLKSPIRERRKKAWESMRSELYKHNRYLENLFDNLKGIRVNKSLNASFKNYRDYMFKINNRFDYTPDDCFEFHNAVKNIIVPITKKLFDERKKKLDIDTIKPWDRIAEAKKEPKLKPFTTGNELLNGVIKIYNMLNPDFARFLKIMKKHDMFDLESRKGKSPGGYNYSLQKTGMPFIFMNAVGLHKDLITLLHEGGHATHTFLMKDIPIIEYRNTPSEVAEFASMSMELLTMDFWNIFYKDSDALIKAKKDHIANIIDFFPWCISVDKFSWHLQLHIFEVPFYYIEYGMAQLGALQIWRNYKKNPEKAIKLYTNALKLGNSKPISEIYNTAGVEFRFDEPFIKEIMDFTVSEYNKLN
jgi:oligoendopeptidase F